MDENHEEQQHYSNRNGDAMLEDDEYDSYYMSGRSNNNDDDDDEDVSLFKKPKVIALTKQELAGEFPSRPEYIVTDTISYLNLASMFVILFSNVTCGTSTKSIFADDQQGLVIEESPFDF